jgi:hypothetical protein
MKGPMDIIQTKDKIFNQNKFGDECVETWSNNMCDCNL